ncbi:hypothetical protein FSARC_8023 [Fusarium sarcochroum]|uniref:Uncharacterized protein n=1 Tax=Fusarium sarcochroum TaxID=1208366 RepID=A0A8H4X7D4_9HYPO|nr:hypothetical protein FSARC_8023 [Fusarium sarcochroum]
MSVKKHGIITQRDNDIVSLHEGLHPTPRPNNPDTTWDLLDPLVPKHCEHTKILASSVLLTLHKDQIVVLETGQRAASEAAFKWLDAQHELFKLLPPNQQELCGLSSHAIDAGKFLAYVMIGQKNVDFGQLSRATVAIEKPITRSKGTQETTTFAQNGVLRLQVSLQRLQES